MSPGLAPRNISAICAASLITSILDVGGIGHQSACFREIRGTDKWREAEAAGSAEPTRTFAEEAPAPHPKSSIRPLDLAGSMRMYSGIPLHHKGCLREPAPEKCPAFVPRRAPPGHLRSSTSPSDETKTTLRRLGTALDSSSRRLAQTSTPASTLTPVMLPPGRARFEIKPKPNGVAGKRYDRDRRCRRLEAKGHRRSRGGNHIGICGDHFSCNLLETSGLILHPIDNEVFTFDVAEAPQFFKEGCRNGVASDPEIFDFHRQWPRGASSARAAARRHVVSPARALQRQTGNRGAS